MQSGSSQEALILCPVKKGPHYIFCLEEKHDKQLPPMSALLIQNSIQQANTHDYSSRIS